MLLLARVFPYFKSSEISRFPLPIYIVCVSLMSGDPALSLMRKRVNIMSTVIGQNYLVIIHKMMKDKWFFFWGKESTLIPRSETNPSEWNLICPDIYSFLKENEKYHFQTKYSFGPWGKMSQCRDYTERIINVPIFFCVAIYSGDRRWMSGWALRND